MAGGSSGSAEARCTEPRDVAAARSCRCQSRELVEHQPLGVARVLGAERVHLDLHVGPVERRIGFSKRMHSRRARHHRAVAPQQVAQAHPGAWRSGCPRMSFSVTGRVHSKEMRVCRWSRQFSPTPRRQVDDRTRCRTAPAARGHRCRRLQQMRALHRARPRRSPRGGRARAPLGARRHAVRYSRRRLVSSTRMRWARAPVRTVSVSRPRAGSR